MKICINSIRRFPEIEKIITDQKLGWGRTWSKNKTSRLYGSHLTFISESEVVILAQNKDKDKKLFLFCYQLNQPGQTAEKILAQKIISILEKNQVEFISN